jgi:hypothetical protein
LLIATALLAIPLSGCASWTDRATDKAEAKLPTLKPNARSLVLEVEFVPVDVDTTDADDIQSLWQWVDETAVDSATRHDWLANGLRVGRVVRRERLHSRLAAMKSPQNAIDQFLSEADIASDVAHGGKQIPMRLGRRYELPLREPVAGSHVTLVRLKGETIGQTLTDPQYLLAITTNDGQSPKQVELTLRPEIQHGAMKQQWVTSDSALRIDRRREAWSLEELTLKLMATEGDLFMIAGTIPRAGLGKQMLSGNRADSMEQQVIMLIRVEKIPSAVSKL